MIVRRVLVTAVICALGVPGRPISIAACEPAPDPREQTAGLVATATAAFTALRYDDALQLADQAWRSGASDPAQVCRIFALAGRAAAAVGDGETARLWFRRWLYLEPAAALPDGTSPKLAALVDDARGALAGAVIAARTSVRPGRITVTVAADPLELVAAARAGTIIVALRDHTASVPAREAHSDIELVDRYGNTLLIVTEVPPAPVPAPAAVPNPRPWFARWPVWAVTSVGLTGFGGGALWVAIHARSNIDQLNAHSDSHQFSQVLAFERRFHDARLVSGIAFTGAALSAITAAVLWSRSHGEPTMQVSITRRSALWSIAF
jgi:hypothetical protein